MCYFQLNSWKQRMMRTLRVSPALLLLPLAYLSASHSVQAQMKPISENPLIAEGFQQMNSGEMDAALETFQQVLSKDADDASALLGSAMIYADSAEHNKAFETYSRIVQIDPQNAFAWNGRGLAAFNMEDFDEALNSFENAIQDRPINGFFYESLAWTRMCRGEFSEAANTAKTATLMYNRKGETTVYPLLIAYFSYLEAGKYREAKAALEYAARNKPSGTWPAPVVDYLRNEISQEALISYVMDTAQETEAHTYIGLQLRAKGLEDQAFVHLNWVSQNGDERVFEYTLARALNLRTNIAGLIR